MVVVPYLSALISNPLSASYSYMPLFLPLPSLKILPSTVTLTIFLALSGKNLIPRSKFLPSRIILGVLSSESPVIGTKSKKDTSYDSGALSPVILTLNFSPATYLSIPSGLKIMQPCSPYPPLSTLK